MQSTSPNSKVLTPSASSFLTDTLAAISGNHPRASSTSSAISLLDATAASSTFSQLAASSYKNSKTIPSLAPLTPVMGGAYTCERCGNSYARPHSLNRHKRFECGVEPKFECPICRKKSKHKHNLVLHMRTHQPR